MAKCINCQKEVPDTGKRVVLCAECRDRLSTPQEPVEVVLDDGAVFQARQPVLPAEGLDTILGLIEAFSPEDEE